MTKAITGDNLARKQADSFFKDIDFVSIVDTIKNIYMSDGAMNTLLDFERVLDEADIYAFRNWINVDANSTPPTLGEKITQTIVNTVERQIQRNVPKVLNKLF